MLCPYGCPLRWAAASNNGLSLQVCLSHAPSLACVLRGAGGVVASQHFAVVEELQRERGHQRKCHAIADGGFQSVLRRQGDVIFATS